jgi:hypothetical protein
MEMSCPSQGALKIERKRPDRLSRTEMKMIRIYFVIYKLSQLHIDAAGYV